MSSIAFTRPSAPCGFLSRFRPRADVTLVRIDSTVPTLRRPRSTVYGISELIEFARAGRLRIPRFQRGFVWDQKQIRELFDSIWRGFPVGTLLFWEHEAEAAQLTFGPVEISASESPNALWVVDGQQRITTLIGVLADVDNDSDGRFDLCFDLRRGRFVHAGKRPLPYYWLPLRVTLESRTLLAWLRENGDQLEPGELDLADEVAGALRDYRLSAYIVEHDDEQLLRDVFDRVNSAGKPISRAQVFHALFGGEGELGSSRSVAERLLPLGFGELTDERIVQSLLALRGGDVLRDLHDEFDDDEDRAEWFDYTEVALKRTIEFFRSIGVPHLLLLPSTFPIPVLAAFFHLHPEPEPWVRRLLARWAWRGWVHGYGAITSTLRQSVQAVHPVQGEPGVAPDPYEAVAALLQLIPDERPPSFRGSSKTNSSAGRLALLAIADADPISPEGAGIDVRAALETHGVDAITELVPGHRARLESRGFWPVGLQPPTGLESAEVLESHLIDDQVAAALQRGDHEAALDLRHVAIDSATSRFLAVRLEHQAPAGPPVEQLFVADPSPSEPALVD